MTIEQHLISSIENEPFYITLIEDCKDIVVETEFTSRWALVEGYYLLGTRILTDYENFHEDIETGVESSCQTVFIRYLQDQVNKITGGLK